MYVCTPKNKYLIMRYFLFLMLLSFSIVGFSQVKKSKTKTHVVTITMLHNEYSQASIIDITKKKVKPKIQKNYLWYINDEVKTTSGGFDGKLLHGTYTTYYQSNNLKSKGNVCYGLRDDTWTDWYENGRIKQISNWNKGVMCGEFMQYNETGQLLVKANYKKGRLHGKYLTFSSDGSFKTDKYKKGIIVTKVKSKKEDKVVDTNSTKVKKPWRLFNKKAKEVDSKTVIPDNTKKSKEKSEKKRLFQKKEPNK